MNPFQALLLEGIFLEDEPLRVETPNGIVEVGQALDPYVGQDVIFTSHHLPEFPLEPMQWGGGSCKWFPRQCPVGHHLPERRGWLYHIKAEGVLCRGDSGWSLEQFDGTCVSLPLGEMLPGHQARIACVTKFSAEQMREALARGGHLDLVEGLGTKISDLQSMLNRLGKVNG